MTRLDEIEKRFNTAQAVTDDTLSEWIGRLTDGIHNANSEAERAGRIAYSAVMSGADIAHLLRIARAAEKYLTALDDRDADVAEYSRVLAGAADALRKALEASNDQDV